MNAIVVICVVLATVSAGPVNNSFNWRNVVQSDFNHQQALEEASVQLDIQGRVAGGMIATPHQFPYQIGLRMQSQTKSGTTRTTWCGASLISNKVVLTAAHCLDGVSTAVVFLGAQNKQKTTEGTVLQNVDSKNFIIHPEYDAVYTVNDIALIVLPQEVVLNEYIQTIDLPEPNQDEASMEGKLAVASGWGHFNDQSDDSDELRYASLRILPGSTCQKPYPYNFHPSQICVSGDDKKSVCTGDSGGPLVLVGNDGYSSIIGIVSFGRREGCELGYPTIFTRVTSFLDWIESSVGVKPKSVNN